MDEDAEYAEYLSKEIDEHSKLDTLHIPYKSAELGDIDIQIYFENVVDDKWTSSIYVKFTIPENMSEDAVYDAFESDYKLQAFLKEKVENFIKDANSKINIYHPKNENLVFKNNYLYMEISSALTKHNVEWVKLQLDSDIDQQTFIDNMIKTHY